jgi:hypothetical protein
MGMERKNLITDDADKTDFQGMHPALLLLVGSPTLAGFARGRGMIYSRKHMFISTRAAEQIPRAKAALGMAGFREREW